MHRRRPASALHPLWYGLRFLGYGGACVSEVFRQIFQFFLAFAAARRKAAMQPTARPAQPAQTTTPIHMGGKARTQVNNKRGRYLKPTPTTSGGGWGGGAGDRGGWRGRPSPGVNLCLVSLE